MVLKKFCFPVLKNAYRAWAPVCGIFFVVGRARIELTTNGLKVRCSTKLS